MKDHNGYKRGFYDYRKAWYTRSDAPDEIGFGLYHPDVGMPGGMSIVWERLAGKWSHKLEIFDDAWSTLVTFRDLLEEMAAVDSEDITPDEFIAILKRCGFEDLTPYICPYKRGG